MSEIDLLKEEIKLDNRRIADLEKVLYAIPECPVHGGCIPHALEWIERMKNNLHKSKN